MPEEFRVLAPLIVAALGTFAVATLGAVRPRLAPPLAVATAALALATTLLMPAGGRVDLAWAPTWDLRLTFAADGLAKLYALLATGVGLAVLTYAAGYMPRHAAHEGHPLSRTVRLYSLILLFMTAMLGLVLAQDLIVLIIFWDLTAITSYYLIGYEQEQEASRRAAMTALLVTGISAILLILAGVLLYTRFGTAQLPDILAQAQAGPFVTATGALIAIAALAKSAQVPMHFWLPQAMVAPTPVSSYLHSAAMVAAGVFLLGRVHPLLDLSPGLQNVLMALGFASMAIGGVLALAQMEIKRLLAYSTIAQYGYVVVMLSLGAVEGAAFYILAHALIKSALFMSAGAVTEATGETDLTRLGGLARSLPLLAVGSGLAAAGLAALPLTMGFFKDEVFFAAAAERGGVVPVLAVAGAVLSFAYTWRFWGNIFLGPLRNRVERIPWTLTLPVLALGVLVGLGGIVPGPAASLAADAGEAMAGRATPLQLAYHFDLRAPNLMAVITWVLGVVAILTAPRWATIPRAVARTGDRYGPDRGLFTAIIRLTTFSRRTRAFLEVRNLQWRIATVLVATAVLVGVTIVFAPPWPTFRVGRLPTSDWPLFLFLVLAALSALVATRSAGRLTLVLSLSAVGYSLAAVFTFIGAPDVALVALLIETMMTLLLLAVLGLLPIELARAPAEREPHPGRRRAVGFITTGFVFVICWGVLSWPAPDATMARAHLELSPAAHAADVVTAILADFRGLDTLGEITVIAVALLGALTFFASRRSA